MQLELKRIQHEVGITFVHVTHDQEEAMTMADWIVDHERRPDRAARHAERALRAARDGVRGGLPRRLESADGRRSSARAPCRLTDGTIVRVPPEAPERATGTVRIGIRPEKLRIGGGERRTRSSGVVTERAYIGVSTQYVVDTPVGAVTVYVQNDRHRWPGRDRGSS